MEKEVKNPGWKSAFGVGRELVKKALRGDEGWFKRRVFGNLFDEWVEGLA